LKIARERIDTLAGRPHFDFGARRIGLVSARQIFGMPQQAAADELAVVVLDQHGNSYGVVVDRFLGERELVVQPLDPRLGKLKDIAAGALAEDGSPVLIVDVEDLVRSIDRLSMGAQLNPPQQALEVQSAQPRKRVLVVDDSMTVRELQRKLIDARGYAVEVAVDGMDAWNAVRNGAFDLVITDVDMPRLDGIELVKLIRSDSALKSLPIVIVSYKDREEDRLRGLDAGADYYLTKSAFHDASLLDAVIDLIGEANPCATAATFENADA
jgi:two-component system sensor histidine kinase and response regulator WspE